MAGSRRRTLKNSLSPFAATPLPAPDIQDDDLLDDILSHIDSKDTSTNPAEVAIVLKEVEANEAKGRQDSRSRFEARKARKAAEQASQLTPDDKDADTRLQQEALDEERAIQRICDELGLEMYEINPDGHCLFAAIADQLRILGILPPSEAHYATTRRAASQFMWSHPDEFVPFLPSVEGEDGAGATDAGVMGSGQFERYCSNIRNTGAWGGEPEIQALSKVYNVPIHVIQHGTPPVVIHDPTEARDVRDKHAARISYHRRMYGLGEHYNSLRPKSSGGLAHNLVDGIKSIISA